MAAIELDHLTKVYSDGTRAVDRLDLEIEDGELVVFVGPSGCGKTSALRMVAGLEDITDGEVRVGGKVVNDLPPKARDIAMIFQNYALYPHMSVYDNMGFGLKMRGLDRAEVRRRVEKAARILGLEEVLRKRPRHLSGGQRQRVAMGRAIVREPQAFLMDEPLSNLDAKLRVQVRAEIARIQRDLQVTTIYVTHDQSEAVTLGDRVCVLRDGVLQQVDRPQVLYERPTNLFVAGFIGSPAMNLVEADLVERGGTLAVSFGPHELEVPDAALAVRPELRRYAGRRVILGIRPEDIGHGDPSAGAALDVQIEIREDMGAEIFLHFPVEGQALETAALKEIAGDEAAEAADAQRGHADTWIARVPRDSSAREGERARLAVDARLLHFFDLETGGAIYETQRASTRPTALPATA
ncbi:MAG: ABC transporter ATP-binding protein [Gaiellaceae bacterium]